MGDFPQMPIYGHARINTDNLGTLHKHDICPAGKTFNHTFLDLYRNFTIRQSGKAKPLSKTTLTVWSEIISLRYVELQDQWNGPYFFLKKSCLSPR